MENNFDLVVIGGGPGDMYVQSEQSAWLKNSVY